MGRIILEYLDGRNIYTCSGCGTHLTTHRDLLSKAFTGRTGRAYLFNKVINTFDGVHENQILMTGPHTICNLYCKRCQSVVGWKYIRAYEEDQKYKEGKFILEKANLTKEKWGDVL